MKKKPEAPSQLMELFLAVAGELGVTSDQDIAALADAGPENVANWRTGAVKEFKNQKFRAAVDNLTGKLRALRAQAGSAAAAEGLHPLEIEEGSSPADLQRQFRERVGYDYLGHRFLYFEPQGALAWENLIKAGYEQERWVAGVAECAATWFDLERDGAAGPVKGPLARALGYGRRERARGLDLVSLGCGDGGKELAILDAVLATETAARHRLDWLAYLPVDVSIALLLHAAASGRAKLLPRPEDGASRSVLAFCADFEEGPLYFARRLRTALPTSADGLRLVAVLGNVLGNLRDEEVFVRQKLGALCRPGDFAWFEVGLRMERLEDDPLYALTRSDRAETAGDANRRLLLEGPYRRWAAATGRGAPSLDSRVWIREDDDSARIPGSANFCHDLVIKDEGRVCTMLYSRRYKLEQLGTWFEGLGYAVEGVQKVRDTKGRTRVGHLLLRRR
jgi:hypothetical protein